MQSHHVPGLSLAILTEGEPDYLQAYGLSSVELSNPAVVDSVYEIGSIIKQFTASAIMLLAQEGCLGLAELVS